MICISGCFALAAYNAGPAKIAPNPETGSRGKDTTRTSG